MINRYLAVLTVLALVLSTVVSPIAAFAQESEPVLGCTDSTAINYNADATQDDGSCEDAPIVVDLPIDPVVVDTDSDTVEDSADNCVDVANTDQADVDGDDIGDACDPTDDSLPPADPTEGDGAPTVSLSIQLVEEPITYAPYCGDEMVNQDWEQCDGGAFCTEQCLFPMQAECPLDIQLARINVDDFENNPENPDADISSNLFIGSLDNMIPAGAWFALTPDDGAIASWHDAPGLAVKRFDDSLKIHFYGNHDPEFYSEVWQERIEGSIEFFGAFATGATSESGNNALENPLDGQYYYDNPAHGEDELGYNGETGETTFSLSTDTKNDGFDVDFELAEAECLLDPIDENGAFIQGRKFRDVNENGNFDAAEKNADGNPNRLNDWTINLFDTDWNLIDTMETGEDDGNWNPNHTSGSVDKGQYRFTNLAAGTYYVCEETQEDWEQTSPRETVLETTIADAENISTVVDPNNDENYCYEVELTEDQEQTNVKFGNLEIPEIPEQDFLKVHIVKYLDGQLATTGPEAGYPMESTWQTANLSGGATSSGNYILGNFHGGNPNQYGADTSSMESPAYYSTHELTTEESEGSPVLPADAVCVADKYRLVGYSTGNTLEAAELASKSTTTPEFYGLTADKYVIVWNEDCDTEPNQLPVITILGDNPFSLLVNNPFVDPFATSTDAEDGDLTSLIATSTDLNINTIGTYNFVYSVTDSDGATAYATRTVNVIEDEDNEEPPCEGDSCQESEDEDEGGGGSSGSRPNPGNDDEEGGGGGTEGGQPIVDNGGNQPGFGQGGAEGGLALLGGGDFEGGLALGDDATTTASTTATTTDDNNTNQLAAVGALGGLFGISWWWWILILILLGIVGYYTFRDKENN